MQAVMSLFNGHKTQCRRRCGSWFSLTPEVERSCRKLCNTGRTEFTKEEFLCKEGVIDEELLIMAFGYDPCEGGIGIEDVLDPLDTAGDEQRDFDRYKDVLVVGAALVVLAIISMIVILRK